MKYVVEEYTDLNEFTLVATYNYYYSGSIVTGVRKIETNRTLEFEGDFVRPIYDNNGTYNYESWWMYRTVNYTSGGNWYTYNNVVIKYNHSDGKWYLYELADPNNPWTNWGNVRVASNTQITLYDSIGGNLITSPTLPPSPPLPLADSSPMVQNNAFTPAPEVTQIATYTSLQQEVDQRLAVDSQLNTTYSSQGSYTLTPDMATDSASALKEQLIN